MTSQDLPLAAEFPAATREQWLKLVDQVLKGAPFDKRLVSQTYDGLRVEPLYPRAPDARRVVGVPTPWRIMQRVDLADPAAANTEALHDLENGATGLVLVFAGSPGSHRHGLDATETTLARALEGVHLDAGIAIEIDLSARAKDAPGLLAALVKQRGLAPDAADIRFGLDPIGAFAIDGISPRAWRDLAPAFAASISDLAGRGFRGPFAVADGRIVHAAGGSEAQELAYALTAAVAYLRALEAGGIALDAARSTIFFRLAADADQFLTLAKFRAVRKLWARVEDACGLAPQPAFVSAETAWRMLTRRDPYVNMLRATVAVFSAALGGADAVAVLPHTLALGQPDRVARRIARNTQLVLQEESHLAKVADPGAGAGGIEDLTAQLCAAAWTLFQEIEKAGGAWSALEQGLIQRKVAAVRAAREAAIARRKDALTGTSEFPNIHEASAPVLDLATSFPALVEGAEPAAHVPSPLAGEGQGGGSGGVHNRIRMTPTRGPSPHEGGEQKAFAAAAAPLAPMRLAAPFEKLRDESDRLMLQTGSRPKVFLATLGPVAAFTARAMFAKNFFEAGGIEAVTNEGFATPSPLPMGEVKTKTDVAALAAAFAASGAALACLCSSDKVYAEEAVAAAEALQAAGARHVYFAGRPGELEAALKAAGVEDFVYVGCDVLKTLQAAHDRL